ncbi:MAG: GTPase HflX, partial [Rubrivivax sp.]
MSANLADAARQPDDNRTRVVLVGVNIGNDGRFDPTLDELALLAASAGDVAVSRITANRRAPDPALFVGSGKADE